MKTLPSILLLLLAVAPASAQSICTYLYFEGTGPQSWYTPSRWDCGHVPGPEDTALLGVHHGFATIPVEGPATVAQLHMLGGLGVSGSGTLTVSELLVWERGYMEGAGFTVVGPEATLTIEPTFLGGIREHRHVINQGTGTWSGGQYFDLVNEGPGDHGISFENRGTLELSVEGRVVQGRGRFVNAEGGVLRRSGEGASRMVAPFDNKGTVEVLEGALEVQGFGQSGGTDSGSYEVAEGAALVFDGNQTLTELASVTGSGTLRTGSHLQNSERTVVVDGALDIRALSLGAIGLEINAEASVDTLRMMEPDPTVRLGGSGTLTVRHEMRWTNGRLDGSGTVRIAEEAELLLSPSSDEMGLRGTRRLLNEGTVTWTSGDGRRLTNETGTIFENRGTVHVISAQEEAAVVFHGGHFTNAEGALLRWSGEGGSAIGGGLDNHGLVEVREGELELRTVNSDGVVDSGTYAVAEGARLEFNGMRVLGEGAVFTGGGTVAQAPAGLMHRGAIRPGASVGLLAWEAPSDPLVLQPEAVLEIEVAGHAPGLEHDVLAVSGRAALGGTLRLLVLEDFLPDTGDRFTVLTASEVLGTFEGIETPAGIEATVETTDSTAVVVIGRVTVSAEEPVGGAMPAAFALHAAYPNPSSGRTTLAFEMPEAAPVRLSVFDVLGRRVAMLLEEARPAGRHEAVLEAAGLPTGLYFVRLEAGAFTATRRVVVAR